MPGVVTGPLFEQGRSFETSFAAKPMPPKAQQLRDASDKSFVKFYVSSAILCPSALGSHSPNGFEHVFAGIRFSEVGGAT